MAQPVVGTTEVWQLINNTDGYHPVHIHDIEFQVISRTRCPSRTPSADQPTDPSDPLDWCTRRSDDWTALDAQPGDWASCPDGATVQPRLDRRVRRPALQPGDGHRNVHRQRRHLCLPLPQPDPRGRRDDGAVRGGRRRIIADAYRRYGRARMPGMSTATPADYGGFESGRQGLGRGRGAGRRERSAEPCPWRGSTGRRRGPRSSREAFPRMPETTRRTVSWNASCEPRPNLARRRSDHATTLWLQNLTRERGMCCGVAARSPFWLGCQPGLAKRAQVIGPGLEPYPRPGFSTEAVQTPARVNVTCVTPLGEEVASTW